MFFTAVIILAFSESDYTISEGGNAVEVCVMLIEAPVGGLECNITVQLGLQDGFKTGTACKNPL